ncbi:hypothetical protein B0H13DRAFT_2666387 [Mycena leptocephala]|nr:hypothetical protein B0H13DRAFT_2666387 [Mycena leptocephala]
MYAEVLAMFSDVDGAGFAPGPGEYDAHGHGIAVDGGGSAFNGNGGSPGLFKMNGLLSRHRDLLAYIFVLGTHEPINPPPEQQDDDCQPFDSESVKTPLVYASVSRHWREVALNTPALYTSLCITPELFREVGEKEVLDTTGISSYLALSRNYLVDILIDARDQQWNFEDDGAWFSAEHMSTAMGVLLPHLGRWRSLSILTDVYAPMHAALRPLEIYFSAYGAPHLESLRLMRCDAYAAHAPAPEPEHVFLSSVTNCGWILPSLRHITLRGVPAAWNALAAVLPDCLRTFELSFHSLAAQPSVPELSCLLRAVPNLARLVMNGSGPVVPEAAELIVPSPSPSRSSPRSPSATPPPPPGSPSSASSPRRTSTHSPWKTRRTPPRSSPSTPCLSSHASSPPPPLPPARSSPPRVPRAPPRALRWPPAPSTRRAPRARRHLPAALALESTELRVRGPLVSTSVVPRDEALAATGAALRALVEARGAAAAPQTICLHEAAYALREVEEEEFKLGGTRVRVFRRVDGEGEGDGDGDGDDEDTVMGSEPECGWDGEDEAFKVGGVFNDPVFDARYGYVG